MQVMYNAQMIRTWNLLLRNARRSGYVVAGGQETGQLVESPYLMHPVEEGHVGLYREPVATLDFASLYPSLYRWATGWWCRAGAGAVVGPWWCRAGAVLQNSGGDASQVVLLAHQCAEALAACQPLCCPAASTYPSPSCT